MKGIALPPPQLPEAGAKMIVYPVRRLWPAYAWFVVGLGIAVALALGLYWWAMAPSREQLQPVATLLGIIAFVVAVLGFAAFRWLWGGWLHNVALTWLSGYLLTGVLTLLIGFGLAQFFLGGSAPFAPMMLILVFVVSLSISLGYLQSATMLRRVEAIIGAGDALATGRLQARVEEKGLDQLAHLGAVVNAMAARVATVDRKERQLERLRRNLSAWIGYDLRLPLASLRSQLDSLIADDFPTLEARQHALLHLHRDLDSLSDLIDDLYDLGQADLAGIQLHRRLVSMSDVLEGVVTECMPLAQEKKVALAGKVAPGTPSVMIDPRQVGRALNNLVHHSIHRTPQGGSVKINAYPTRAGALVEVVDNYPGARSDEMEQIRALYFGEEDVRSTFTGDGRLGLAMARAIVAAHGSQIRAEVIPDQGLRLVFPLSQADGPVNPLARGM